MRRLTYQVAIYNSSILVEIVSRDSMRDAWREARRRVRAMAYRAGVRLDPTFFGQGYYQTRNRAGYGINRYRATDLHAERQ